MKIINNLKLRIKNWNWVLLLVLVIASILRLSYLDSIPPGLTPDEAALGYNAYSIFKTGRDEYGKFMPIIFKSFGDYKPGLYVYAALPFIAVFGLNEWSVRLPSALSGIVIVWLIYLITDKLKFKIKNFEASRNLELKTAAAFVAALNPWLIYFSRGAWEANLSLALALGGVYFFIRSLQNNKFFVFSSLLFSLTLLTYQGAKLSTGIVVFILAILYWKEIFKFNRKYLFAGVGFGAIVAALIVVGLLNGQGGRLEVFSVFSYPRPKDYLQVFLDEGKEKVGGVGYYLFHSESLNFARGILGRWFNHFSPRFLFFEGDWSNPRHTSPHQGVLMISDLITLLAGLFAIAKISSLNRRKAAFIILWLFSSPLPAALSRDQVHAVRSLNMAIPLVIIISLGICSLINWISIKKFKLTLLTAGILLYAAGLVYFLDSYFVHLPAHNSSYWYYGYKQMVKTVIPIQDNYKTVKVQQSFAQPYIYFLFYGAQINPQRYDPAEYQKTAKLISNANTNDVGLVAKLGNIRFVDINWPTDRGDKGTLFVADTVKIPPADSSDTNFFSLVSEIKYLNGRDIAFRILTVK